MGENIWRQTPLLVYLNVIYSLTVYSLFIFSLWIYRLKNLHPNEMNTKSELDVKIGVEVRRRRLEQHRSQEAFADDCGIHRTYMSSIERGEKAMSVDMAKRVVTGLGLTLGEFFTAIEE